MPEIFRLDFKARNAPVRPISNQADDTFVSTHPLLFCGWSTFNRFGKVPTLAPSQHQVKLLRKPVVFRYCGELIHSYGVYK